MNGRPQARVGDAHRCPLPGHGVTNLKTGCVTVLVNNQPAVRLGDLTTHGAVVAEGETSVLIGNMPSARIDDASNHGGVVIEGSPDVIVGSMSYVGEPEGPPESLLSPMHRVYPFSI